MDNAQLHELLSEAGPLVDALSLTVEEEEGIWAFEFETEPACAFEIGANPEHIVLSGEIAPVPDEGREGLYEMMLLYNDKAAETGGLRLGIDAPGGIVTISVDVARNALTPDTVTGLVTRFRELRAQWIPVVSGWGDGAPGPKGPLPDLTMIPV